MDCSSILAYKTLFLANRAKGTKEQLGDGKKFTGVANGVRCAITTSQAAVPLFAVSTCLAKTSKNRTVASAAKSLAKSNLKNIAYAVTSDKTTSAIKGMSSAIRFLSKLGLAGNLAYATAKCLDADEEDKTRVFMKASGNCAGMYLFENIYSNVVDKINPADVTRKTAKVAGKASKISKFMKNIPLLKKVKLGSIVAGVGFVVASLTGCMIGELIGESTVRDNRV